MAGILMRKFVPLLLYTSISVCILSSDQRHSKLDLISSIPGTAASIFFKTTPSIAVDNSGIIYAMDNRLSELYIINPSAHLVKTIAKEGQGPGELSGPTHLAVDENRIYVKDNYGVSIYNKEGIFENRFRLFHLTIDLAVDNEKIYLAQGGSQKLITVYDLKGNKVLSFGSKYPVDYELYKEWSPQLTDGVINTGRILFSPSAIYFVSTLFADIFVYDKNGRFVSRKRLVPEGLVKEIENQFFHIGLTDKKKHGYGFFCDVTYYQGKFYGLALRKIFMNSPGDIISIREGDLRIDEIYGFPDEEIISNWRLWNIRVRKGDNGQPQFCLSYYDDKQAEFVISIFQGREEKK